VIEVLSRLVSERGAPVFLRSDNGPEFVSKALLSWIVGQGIGTALIEPGKPWQNGVTESFNGKFRDECLSLEWFRSRAEAKVIIETWRQHYNAVRPHSSLGYLTPNEFVAHQTNAAPRQATGRSAAVLGPSRRAAKLSAQFSGRRTLTLGTDQSINQPCRLSQHISVIHHGLLSKCREQLVDEVQSARTE
jgi:putative transposase